MTLKLGSFSREPHFSESASPCQTVSNVQRDWERVNVRNITQYSDFVNILAARQERCETYVCLRFLYEDEGQLGFLRRQRRAQDAGQVHARRQLGECGECSFTTGVYVKRPLKE